MHDTGTRHALCRSLDDPEFGDHGGADAIHLFQARGGRGQYPVEIAKGFDQAAGQRLYILARDGAEQDQFKKFVVRHRRRAARHEAFAQSGTVVCQIGRRLAPGQRDRRGLVSGRLEQGQGHFAKGAIRVHGDSMDPCR